MNASECQSHLTAHVTEVIMFCMINIKSLHSWHQKLLQGHVGSFTKVKSLLLIVVFDP